ncbi:MAG: mechanosensitive ion channel domain-containing protein [Candidatus Hydrothermarchaeales archaeon]
MANYLVALAIVLAAIVVSKLFLTFVERYVEEFAKKTDTKIDDFILRITKVPIYILLILLGIYFALAYVQFPWLSGIEGFFKVIGIVIVTWVGYSISSVIIREYGQSLASRTSTDIYDILVPVAEKITKITIIAIGILVVLDILRIDITPMIAGMGIAGIAIAMAAQDTLSNVFSGFYLMVDRPFAIGDRILLESGELCEVMNIGMRSTRLYNVIDHTQITIPNSGIANTRITNISAPDTKLKLAVPIGVAYESDIDKVKKILLEIADEAPHVLQKPPSSATFRSFGDSSLNLMLVVWIDDVKEKITVLDYINCRIKDMFEEEGIEIPFPIRTVYMQK